MSKQKKRNPQALLTTTTTLLPGLHDQQVIMSSPQLVKENSQHASNEKKDK